MLLYDVIYIYNQVVLIHLIQNCFLSVKQWQDGSIVSNCNYVIVVSEKEWPTFDKVDNPDGRSGFSYRPVFLSGSQGVQYKYHCLPSGCQPVPKILGNTTIRTYGG